MDRVLTDFVKVLRNANVEVSPAETMDAISVIDAIGYANKKLLIIKEVISCCSS